MASLKESGSDGVTLVEIIVVIAIAGILLGVGVPLTWDFYLRSELRAERSNAAQYLRTARTRAMSSRGESAHGVYVATSSFIIFEGVNYVARTAFRDQIFPRSPGITATGTMEFVFTQLSGRSASSTLILESSVGATTVHINSEGLVE